MRTVPNEHDNPTQLLTCVARDVGYGRTQDEITTFNGKKIPYTEDSSIAFSFQYDNGTYEVFVVADGHGGSHEFSTQSCRLTFDLLQGLVRKHGGDVPRALGDLALSIHERISNSDLRRKKGGTTYCIRVHLGYKMWVGNLGDSSVVVFNLNNGAYEEYWRTIDMDASNTDEQARILRNDGNYFDGEQPFERFEKAVPGMSITYLINPKAKRRGISYKLMTTAGFGDYSMDEPIGTISRTLVIDEFDLNPNSIVLHTSDGLYEHYHKGLRPPVFGEPSLRIREIGTYLTVHRNSMFIDDRLKNLASINGEYTEISGMHNGDNVAKLLINDQVARMVDTYRSVNPHATGDAAADFVLNLFDNHVVFVSAFAKPPEDCMRRACTYTGSYGHDSVEIPARAMSKGGRNNKSPPKLSQKRSPKPKIPTWMKRR